MSQKRIDSPRLTPSLTADMLAGQLGGGQALWLARLANWRRSSRVGPPPIPWIGTDAGNPCYDISDIDDFIAANVGKQALVAESRAANPVRAGAMAHLDSPNEPPHVRVSFAITGAMQSVHVLDVDGARRLASMLSKAADLVEAALLPASKGVA